MSPVLVVVAEISSMIVRTLVSGWPRQFIVMKVNPAGEVLEFERRSQLSLP